MPVDKLGVINRALLKVGLPLAAAVNDCDWNASLVFENVVEELLRGFPWGFAQEYAVLQKSNANPPHGWEHAFALPDDCMRVIDVRCQSDLRSPKARYALSGRRIFCNVLPCNVRYVRRELDPALWPPDFLDAAACRIAVEIAALSAENMGLVPQLMQLFNLSLGQAQLADAREQTERVPFDNSIYAARQQPAQG